MSLDKEIANIIHVAVAVVDRYSQSCFTTFIVARVYRLVLSLKSGQHFSRVYTQVCQFVFEKFNLYIELMFPINTDI